MATHNLPQSPTPFIGREQEITELRVLLGEESACRLLTLAGPGGIGKTRLALEVASRMIEHFADGVYLVPLQPLHDVQDIMTTVIDALPLQLMGSDDPQQSLLDYLNKKHLLLVFDNFEHMLDGLDIVTDILKETTQVKLLVTSRERLNLQAEQVWPVNGLDVPEDTADEPENHSAVHLFVERAQRLHPKFVFDPAIVRICRLVDGLPLALELAASWTRILPCEAIADEIQHNIDFMIASKRDFPERHRSMRAVFDHSWRLLSPEEQIVYCKLSVFRGGFTAEAARMVTGSSLEMLAGLFDKSLIRLDDNGRYTLHEQVSQYARERLETTTDTAAIHEAHSRHFMHFMAERTADLKGGRQLEAYDEIEADFDNIRAAWHWAVERRHFDQLNQVIGTLTVLQWDYSRGLSVRDLLQHAWEHLELQSNEQPHPVWYRIQTRLAHHRTHDTQVFEIGLSMARAQNDPSEAAFCLAALAQIAVANKDWQAALHLAEESQAIYRQTGELFDASLVLWQLGLMHHALGNPDQRDKYFEACFRLKHEVGDRIGEAFGLYSKAHLAYGQGKYDRAVSLQQQAMRLHEENHNLAGTAISQAELSRYYFLDGRFEAAHHLAHQAIKTAQDLNYGVAQVWAYFALGLIANVQGDHLLGKKCFDAISNLSMTSHIVVDLASFSQAIAACNEGNPQTAKHLLQPLHKFIDRYDLLAIAAMAIPAFAFVAALEDHKTYAAELLGLAFTHPACATGWIKKWPHFLDIQAALEVDLGVESYRRAYQHGSQLDLMTAFRESLEHIAVLSPSQALIEPLTNREIEILRLVASGLSNKAIAAELTLSVGTIKWYMHEIRTKLSVHNRVQAIRRARELHLLESL